MLSSHLFERYTPPKPRLYSSKSSPPQPAVHTVSHSVTPFVLPRTLAFESRISPNEFLIDLFIETISHECFLFWIPLLI